MRYILYLYSNGYSNGYRSSAGRHARQREAFAQRTLSCVLVWAVLSSVPSVFVDRNARNIAQTRVRVRCFSQSFLVRPTRLAGALAWMIQRIGRSRYTPMAFVRGLYMRPEASSGNADNAETVLTESRTVPIQCWFTKNIYI